MLSYYWWLGRETAWAKNELFPQNKIYRRASTIREISSKYHTLSLLVLAGAILCEFDNSSPPPERDTLTEPEMGGSIFDSSGESSHLNYLNFFKSRALPYNGARSGADYIGKRGNEANCGK